MKTYVAKPTDRERNWLIVDAEGQILGRLATQIADALRGKRKPTYTPHIDTGDFVVVVNAEKIAVTGNKRADKMYYRHSGYPGGLKSRHAQRHARAPARGGHPTRRQGHAPAQPAGAKAAHQAQGLRRPGASARRPAAATDGDFAVSDAEHPEDEQRPDEEAAAEEVPPRPPRSPPPQATESADEPAPAAAPEPVAEADAEAEEPARRGARADRARAGR